MTPYSTHGTRTPTPPFDFDKSLDFLGFFAPMGQAAAKVYGRALLDTELAALAEHYGAYQGYWAHYCGWGMRR